MLASVGQDRRRPGMRAASGGREGATAGRRRGRGAPHAAVRRRTRRIQVNRLNPKP